jgi:ferredoxin
MSQIITRQSLDGIIESLISNGKIVSAPVKAGSRFFFRTLSNSEQLVLDSNIMPINSIKEFFFPQHETICKYRYEGKELVVQDAEPFEKEQFIFAARPCDAASLPILDKVFAWDFQDRFYQQRRKNATVITLACRKADENCFCTSVGLAPDTESGADAMLLQIDANTFEIRTFTDKGKTLFEGKTTESEKTGQTAAAPEIRFDSGKVEKYLAEHFNEQIFDETSLRCVACGACTYLCPTCHCFDIVDEGGAAKGSRVKNWDTCQYPLFTLHASGHNPRGTQSARQRNRIQHKFCIYPGKFGMILCTGCGNCTRECSASLGVRPVLELLNKKAEKTS